MSAVKRELDSGKYRFERASCQEDTFSVSAVKGRLMEVPIGSTAQQQSLQQQFNS